MHAHDPAIADLLARTVAGDAAAIGGLLRLPPPAVIDAALDHGVLGFLADSLPGGEDPSNALAYTARARVQQEIFEDLLREAELKRAVAALDESGVRPLVIKGGQLAYTHYPRPDLRPRVDSDLMIPANARPALHEVLTRLAYRRQAAIEGELVSSQSMYVKYANGTPTSALDVHWRIANAQVFAGVLEYDELAAAAVAVPALGPAARGLSTTHALLLACVHRVAHHYDSERLIWLFDIHLLANAMSAAEWAAFAELAAQRQVVAVSRRSLERTRERFGTALPDELWAHPRWRDRRSDELSAGYLEPRRTISAMADDLRSLPSWNARWRLTREHLFPPAHYMRTVFAPASHAPLVWLHIRRLLRGARKWLARG